jgi:hypothetical protein
MKSSKQKRRANALSRFRVMPFNEWLKARSDGAQVGADAQTLLDAHAEYCQRKAVERASLEKGG